LPKIIFSSKSSIFLLNLSTSIIISSIEISPSASSSNKTSISLLLSSIPFQVSISFSILEIFFRTAEAFKLSSQKLGVEVFDLRLLRLILNDSKSKIPPERRIFLISYNESFFYFRYFHLLIYYADLVI
tara:strand:+ start:22 stop:408 length:387 start_codon:yes stop_codon:yes gene_type:complete